MAERVSVYVHTEKSEPVRRVIRNDGVLYLLLLAGAIGCIVLSRFLSNRLGIMRLLVQIVLYAVLLGGGYAVYRYLLVGYRYTLTSEELMVYRSVGSRDTLYVTVPLKAVTETGKWQSRSSVSFDGRTFTGKRSDAFCIYYQTEHGLRAVCLSASDRMRELITESVNGQ